MHVCQETIVTVTTFVVPMEIVSLVIHQSVSVEKDSNLNHNKHGTQ